ncbi:glycoside hydrolase family 32 protein [Agriterribacter sp.]|uniref:glycoside hydrolase family 32 protein n=1 Tax=Agriterribacter sp. TaxID=2821509 RepID=UPI002C78C433|nr:glycoside hydrolase family 32 protein [Agriterribacter sp.]HRP54561.1 glycoside hydrolase family 32 protein [Agriterribacter sp.]
MKRRNFLQASGMFPFIAGNLAKDLPGNEYRIIQPGSEKNIPPPAREFFYRPENAWAGDFIPLYAEGKFQLFYLLDWRNAEKHGEGVPWYRLSTTDFVHYEEYGEVIPRGTKEEQDLSIFTGSALKADNTYHIFYTGHNHHLVAKGKPMQAVMHAVSNDLQHWKKIPEHTFFAPTGRYEKNDWRDPFVYFNEETKEYNMLLAARFNEGIPRRRGLTALCTSKDLVKWEVKDPFYAPNEYITHECPDLFKIGDWWYLVFSEYSDLVATRYRMSRSLKGPWLTPKQDTFDGHAFYAAKTASDGSNRFIFGWNPTRSENKDSGAWNWGGNLVVHQLVQQPNGELTVRVPDTVRKAFSKNIPQSFKTAEGAKIAGSREIEVKAEGVFSAVAAGKMPGTCRISTSIVFSKPPRALGCMLRCSDDLEKCYYIRLEPGRSRLVFDMWPRKDNVISQMIELERYVELKAGSPVSMEVFVDGSIGIVYVNDRVAMDFRAYDLPEGNWGFFVNDGSARFRDIELTTL